MAISSAVNESRIDASLFANIICRSCNIFSHYLQAEMTDRIFAIHADTGVSYEVLADTMIQKWEAYKAARNMLTWTYPTAIGFLRWDLYDQSEAWPWREASKASVGVYKPTEEQKEIAPDWVNLWRKQNGLAPL
jgi:hypothetical protein